MKIASCKHMVNQFPILFHTFTFRTILYSLILFTENSVSRKAYLVQ